MRFFTLGLGLRAGLLALSLGLGAPALAAQTLPLLHPGSVLAESRSGLYFQPWVAPGAGWKTSVGLDYASMLELGFRYTLADTAYLLDAEALRLNLAVSRNLDERHFVLGEVWGGGAYDGFLDGFLNWYHDLLGIPFPERKQRPSDAFGYQYEPDGQQAIRFRKPGTYLGDIRLGIGRRHDANAQSVLSVTLPTHTGGDGFARGVPTVSLLNTLHTPIGRRVIYEGSLNMGYTPKHGRLREYQQTFNFLATSGVRVRTVGALWSFGNLYLHSPYMVNTGAMQLDRWDLTIDFGWMIRSKSGREFRFGMTEDLWPSGPAVDANFRVGYSW